jgi:uncharacterized membrane protein
VSARERGQLTPLLIGFVAIVLLAVVVVANASKAFLHRRSLASWADGAAIVAAQELAESAIYSGEFGDVLPLAEDGARHEVEAYVARHELAGRFDAFSVVDVVVGPDGSVTVEVRATMEFVWAVGPDSGVTMTASATAIAPIGP